MIEVHLLRYALAAADSGSFSRAAEQFRVKQSTLSKHVSYLEQRLGVALFTRSTQGVAPTPSGAQFLARARSIVGELDSLSSESFALARGDAGRLRFGFHGTLAAGDLRATLEQFRLVHPSVELEAIEGERDQLLDHMDRGRIDIAIVAGEDAVLSRRSLRLWSEPVMLGIEQGHALLHRDRIYWTDLRGMRFLVTLGDPGSLIAAMIGARLNGAGQPPDILSRSVTRENLHALVGGTYISVTAGISGPCEGVAFREVHDAFGTTRLETSLHWHEDNTNPALANFLRLSARRYGRAPP